MGYFLIFESMLDSVLFARDKWLRAEAEGGILLPSTATLMVAGLEDGEGRDARVGYWHRAWGFNMGILAECARHEPCTFLVDPTQVVSDAQPVLRLDLRRVPRGEVLRDFEPFRLTISRHDCLHALVFFFDCGFAPARTVAAPADDMEPYTHAHGTAPCEVVLRTGPLAPPTHWMQSVFYLQREFTVAPGDCIEGNVLCTPNAHDTRALDVALELSLKLADKGAADSAAAAAQQAQATLKDTFCFRTELRY